MLKHVTEVILHNNIILNTYGPIRTTEELLASVNSALCRSYNGNIVTITYKPPVTHPIVVGRICGFVAEICHLSLKIEITIVTKIQGEWIERDNVHHCTPL